MKSCVRPSEKVVALGSVRTYWLATEESEPARKFSILRALPASVAPSPVMAGFEFAIAVIPVTASGAPVAAPPVITADNRELPKKLVPAAALTVVLLVKRKSPPNL